ncbi:MAG: ABC-2 type transport system ATP-binding protein [Planctomycetaceae bacterium]
MSDTPAVSVTELKKTYRSGLFRRRKVEALQGVSFDVEPGEIFGLLGPNGAGKTTLIKVLLGLVKRSDGRAKVLDLPAGDRRGRMRIGYLPENHRIPRHLTGNTALEYYGQLSHMPLGEIRRKRGELLASVGLGKWGTTTVASYSKGMLQRLGLAQAMLHDPELLILDEPTDGVDPVGRAGIRDTLFWLKDRGKTVFLNSHLLQELELVCDRVAILQKGLLRHVGPIHELTQATSSGVTFRLAADQQGIQPALDLLEAAGVTHRRTDEGALSYVIIDSVEQSSIDQTVDTFRQAGVSISAIIRKQLTLEEAFLQLVNRDSDETDDVRRSQPQDGSPTEHTDAAEGGNS